MNKRLAPTEARFALISAKAEEIRDLLDDDEWDAETFFDTLDGETDVRDMIDAALLVLTEQEAEAEAAKMAERVWSDRRKGKADAAATTKRNLARMLAATGEEKLRTEYGTISFQKGREGLHVVDLDALPSQLCTIVKKPDAAAIKAAINAGEDVPGAEIKRGEVVFAVRR